MLRISSTTLFWAIVIVWFAILLVQAEGLA
jgi:hypothetical protein